MMKIDKKISDFDSDEEFFGYVYFMELLQKGYIESITEQVSYKLYDGFNIDVIKSLKTKDKILNKILLKSRIYTLDFEVKWTEKAKNTPLITTLMTARYGKYFYIYPGVDLTSHIEIKANYDSNNATRYFSSRTQPWMWEKHGVFVQLIKIPQLFRDTFIPELLLPLFHYKKEVWTKAKPDKPSILKARKGDPKFSWKYKSLKEYINGE